MLKHSYSPARTLKHGLTFLMMLILIPTWPLFVPSAAYAAGESKAALLAENGQTPASELQVVVSPTGQADYRTISEAVKNIPPGGTIVIEPGIYSEALVIDKDVNIIGKGDPQEVIIRVENTDCITLKATRASIRGLLLECASREHGNAISVENGTLTLVNCRIRVYHDANAPTTTPTKDADAKSVAANSLIHILDRSQCVIEDSEIDGKDAKISGVTSDNSGVQMSRCKVTNCSTGLSGGTVIEDSEVSYCATGIDAGKGVTVRRSKIHDCAIGIQGRCFVEDSYLYKNLESGVALEEPVQSTLKRCWFYENGRNAVKASNDSLCLIDRCDFRNQANPLHEEGGARIVNANFSAKNQGFIETEYFKIENDIYNFNGGKNRLFFKQAYYAALPPDFTAQVQAMWDNGKLNSGFGITFRMVDHINFYVFAVAIDGHCYLGRIIDNKWKALVDWEATNLIHPGFNLLKVTCKGQTLTCYINDQPAIYYQDQEWQPVDATAGIGAEGGVMCSFDDFLAY